MGDAVYEEGVRIGRVEHLFWAVSKRRKGLVHSVQISGCDVVTKRWTLLGVLYWSPARRRWVNKLRPTLSYQICPRGGD